MLRHQPFAEETGSQPAPGEDAVTPPYTGDRSLERLLKKAGKNAGVRIRRARDVRAVLQGVLAAPEGVDPDGWMQLVAARPSKALALQLRALKARAEAAPPKPGPAPGERLDLLRARLKRMGFDGMIVPRADAHQGEYVPESEQRLAWLTGFTGSAGAAVVLADNAAVFVDGRYTLQAKVEVDSARFTIQHLIRRPPSEWLAQNAPRGAVVGFDPWLLTPAQVKRFEAACTRAGSVCKPLPRNPLDALWSDRPAAPLSPVRPLALKYAGESAADKRRAIAASLAADGVDACVLSAPDSIAWLLNIRGGDVETSPLPLAFAVIARDGKVTLAIDPRKLTAAAEAHLGKDVKLVAPDDLGRALDLLGKGKRRVRIDPSGTPFWIVRRLQRAGARLNEGPDPCQLPKACKNRVELSGIRAAHIRDGAALTRFIAWLKETAPQGGLTEMAAADVLESMRAENDLFQGLSFPTISGAGPHGAIVHYRVTERTDRKLKRGEIYLLDSGAQYLDGTTDVTRTLFINGGRKPTAAMRDHFTRVLKGHIALGMARFPEGTSGSQLDVLARRPLWDAGLEYDHGTGHGVGHYLNVHEGPQRISQVPSAVALRPGMVVSNEPGYYKTGAYGIRIENLVAVKVSPRGAGANGAGGRRMFAFETLTLAPIERDLIAPELLSPGERDWLNAYHARVRKTLTPLLDTKTAQWLKVATAPL